MGIVRNPYGIDAGTVREARLAVCEEVERLQKENARLAEERDDLAAELAEAKAESEKYRTALIGIGCNDLFCEESSRLCRKCPASNLNKKEA
jgi:hypothetical protein